MLTNRVTLETDTHMHTIASTHAYSTVLEMADYAAQKGLRAIVISDHGPAMEDGPHPWHFGNLRCLPPYIKGVRVLHGVEANIMDYEGNVDIEPRYQEELDWVIASFHDDVTRPGTVRDHTAAYLGLSQNPFVDVIGHSGTQAFAYDYAKLIPVFKANGKLVEINSHSVTARPGSEKNCREIARLCMEYRVPVVVNSDAHCCFEVGAC